MGPCPSCAPRGGLRIRSSTPPRTRPRGAGLPSRAAGNGFAFGAAEPDALLEACGRAMSAWADRTRWRRIMARGMATDHSWDGPAAEYEAAYERAVGVQSA